MTLESQFNPGIFLLSFLQFKKKFKNLKRKTFLTLAKPLMMAYEGSYSARGNFGKFIY